MYSRRGYEGGYGLARPPDRITVGAVIRVLDGPLGEAPPPRAAPGTAARAREGHLGAVWAAATVSVSNVLDATTLEHLMTGHLPEHVRQLARSAGCV